MEPCIVTSLPQAHKEANKSIKIFPLSNLKIIKTNFSANPNDIAYFES